jgi:hypothetical protein
MPNRTSTPPKSIFVSYAHDDRQWLDRILQQLPASVREKTWTDETIRPGDMWRVEIESALANATVAVLLVTQQFLDSRFINQTELPTILDAATSRGRIRVLWIPIESSSYKRTAIKDYQSVWNPERPLAGLHQNECEEALLEITAKITDAIETGVAPPSVAHLKDERWRQTQDICDYIQKHTTKRIDILQFSLTALWSHDFWTTYKNCRDATVRILLMKPERAERRYSLRSRRDVERVAEQIAELDFEQQSDSHRPTVGLWYYDHAPSVAAVIVDEGLIQLGWYLVRPDTAHPERLRVSGHDTPSVMAFGEDVKILLPKIRAHFNQVLAGIKDQPIVCGPHPEELISEWRELQCGTSRA